MAEYDKHIPVYLIDLEPIEFRGEINVDDTETDYNNGRYHFSNTYSINGNGYSEDDGEYKYYADYSLGRKFKYFSGVLHGIRNSAGPGAKNAFAFTATAFF